MTQESHLLDEARVQQQRGRERRTAVRYRIVQRCLVRPADAKGAGSWQAIAYNISAAGVGLALAYPVPEGTVLSVAPWGKTGVRPIQARVVRSSVVSFLLFHGCELVEPLTFQELRRWLT